MADYIGQADRLMDWSVLDIKNHPALTVGMLHSAAASIERLVSEVDRLNRENFWLSRQVSAPDMNGGRMIQLPPVEIGDTVWLVRLRKEGRVVVRCTVCKMEIHGSKVFLITKSRGGGVYGEDVFLTKEEAEKALEDSDG